MTVPATAMPQALETVVIERGDELEQLAEAWAAVWDRCPGATPFQHPEWLLAWGRCFGTQGLRVLVFRQDGELAGLVPMQIARDHGGRRMTLLGTGVSDYLDALIQPDGLDAAIDALFSHLSHEAADVDHCDFQRLPRRGMLAAGLQRIELDSALSLEEQPCPVLPLQSGATRSEAIPPRQAKKLAYYRRRLHRAGTVAVETANHDNLDELLSALVRLHAARWNERGSAGVLADVATQRFHREAARGMLQRNLLRMYGLRVDGQWLAVYYGFAAHGRSYYYLSGFDPAASHLSPGMLIVGHAIDAAIEEGSAAFDFLRGRESYKYAWGARDEPTYRWRSRLETVDVTSSHVHQRAGGRPETSPAQTTARRTRRPGRSRSAPPQTRAARTTS